MSNLKSIIYKYFLYNSYFKCESLFKIFLKNHLYDHESIFLLMFICIFCICKYYFICKIKHCHSIMKCIICKHYVNPWPLSNSVCIL